ncbi:YgfZ/GcvT domain-containing protein [Roseibium sp.]|uniref:CAF17-like 4Fe-4S cluster assembly/insertion protein YgfZ n=1 Tax=Roseibium sp. TaxID=1936156 RepID=UPI003D0A48B1
MPSPFFSHLTDRALIRVAGADAHHFLQNLVTADMETIDQTGAGAAALLTPQGKIQFDFLIYKTGDGYLIDAARTVAADLLKRLTFYRLRAKVELELMPEDTGVFAAWNAPDIDNTLVTVADPRLPELGRRIVAPALPILQSEKAEIASLASYEAHRIRLGVPEGLKDYDYSSIFPHDADLDQLGGVSFTKGCYVGQEVVSRMQHRSSARKRFVQVTSAEALPARGTDITADGKSIGTLGSSTASGDGVIGLALVRLDKVAHAKDNGIPLQCGDSLVSVRLPEWAEFTWPEPSAAN